jgi:hypothetical protein
MIKEGAGVIYFLNDMRYLAMYENNKRTGEGILFLSNGEQYEGNIKDLNIDEIR